MHNRAHNIRAMILDPISTYLCNDIVDPYFPAAHYGLKYIWPRREHRSRPPPPSENRPAGTLAHATRRELERIRTT